MCIFLIDSRLSDKVKIIYIFSIFNNISIDADSLNILNKILIKYFPNYNLH